MERETLKHYLRDLIFLLKENFEKQTLNDDFSIGVKQGYLEILDLIESQANAFGIDLKEIGFNDYENYKNNIG